MASYSVRVVFYDGTSTYTFPVVQSVQDPTPGMKAVIIPGNRADGSIVIPGGLQSQEVIVNGVLIGDYAQLTTAMDAMRSGVTTKPASITIQKYVGGTWTTDKVWNVRRITEIKFSDTLRNNDIEYQCSFIVISY